MPRLSLVVGTGGDSLVVVLRLPLLRVLDSRSQAQPFGTWGLGVPGHMGSSRTRDQTRVPCTGTRATGPPEKSKASLSPGLEPGRLFLFLF